MGCRSSFIKMVLLGRCLMKMFIVRASCCTNMYEYFWFLCNAFLSSESLFLETVRRFAFILLVFILQVLRCRDCSWFVFLTPKGNHLQVGESERSQFYVMTQHIHLPLSHCCSKKKRKKNTFRVLYFTSEEKIKKKQMYCCLHVRRSWESLKQNAGNYFETV